MYTEMEHPMLGTWKFQNAPFKMSKSPPVISRPPPMIGQHNKEVFQELLGLTDDDLIEGYRDGSLWPPEMPKYPYLEEAVR